MDVQTPDNISFSEAATIPFALATAACSLYLELSSTLSSTSLQADVPTVLIWGASGSVGSFAIQLAKASGSRVIAASSTRSIDYVKELGADEVCDTSDSEVVSKVQAATPDPYLAFDTLVTEDSVSKCVNCFGGKAGVLCTAILYKDDKNRSDITFKPTFLGKIQGKNTGPGVNDDGLKLGMYLWEHLTSLIEMKRVRPIRLEITGGLEKVPDGLDRLQEGSYRFKLVIGT